MIKTHFDDIAALYDSSLPEHIHKYYSEKRIKFITGSIKLRGHVLDLGCGTGTLSAALSRLGYNVVGIDQSHAMLRIANSKYIGLHVQAIASELPFFDEQFDAVITIATLHHFVDHEVIKSSIYEALRVIRPEGHLLIWDHNPLNPYWKLLMNRVPQDCGAERLIGKKEILSILADRQNLVDSIRTLRSGFIPDFLPSHLLGIASRIEYVLEKLPIINIFSAHNIILVKRR